MADFKGLSELTQEDVDRLVEGVAVDQGRQPVQAPETEQTPVVQPDQNGSRFAGLSDVAPVQRGIVGRQVERFSESDERNAREFLVNLGASVGDIPENIAKGTAFTLADIIKFAVTGDPKDRPMIAKVATGAAQRLLQPGVQPDEEDFALALDYFQNRYNSWDAVKRTAFEDPGGLAEDLSLVGFPVGGVMRGLGITMRATKPLKLGQWMSAAGEVVDTIGKGTIKAAEAVEPIQAAASLAKGVSAATKKVTGKIPVDEAARPTGKIAAREAGEFAVEIPSGFMSDVAQVPVENVKFVVREAREDPLSKANIAMLDRVKSLEPPVDLIDAFDEAIGKVLEDRGTKYRNKLNKMNLKRVAIGETVGIRDTLRTQLEGFRNPMRKTSDGGWELNFQGSNLADISPTARENVAKAVMITDAIRPGISGDSLDQVKHHLQNLYRRTPTEEVAARSFISGLRKSVRETLGAEVPGYNKMSAEWGEASELLDAIQRMVPPAGERARDPDLVLRRIASAMKADTGVKRRVLEQLSEMAERPLVAEVTGVMFSQKAPKFRSATELSENITVTTRGTKVTGEQLGPGGISGGRNFVVDLVRMVPFFGSPRVMFSFLRALGLTQHAANNAIKFFQDARVRVATAQTGRVVEAERLREESAQQ